MYATIDTIHALLSGGQHCIVAGDEHVLRSLPKGNWIGGTIPYFMGPDGGDVSRTKVFVTTAPDFSLESRIGIYDQASISRLGFDSPENGYTVLIVPAFSPIHQQYALEAPGYEQIFLKVVAGWVAGSHLDDVAKVLPKVFDGRTGQAFDNSVVALHVDLPASRRAKLGIVNIFEQGDGPEIAFPTSGFEANECIVGGVRSRIDQGLGGLLRDIRWPLVANYCGTKCNVSIRDLDLAHNTIRFYAPVFENVVYRQARPVGDYSQHFLSSIPRDLRNVSFSCNCVCNYQYGELQGRRTGALLGPMTFGEIAYQLVNQTLVYIAVD